MKSITLVTTIKVFAILALLVPAGRLAAQNPDSPAITKLLEKVKTHAAVADSDATELEGFTRTGLHYSTHAAKLNQMKQHVNNLIGDANQMSSLRAGGSPWQQDVIDHIQPLLPEMAAHLTATIQHFNENMTRTQMQPYRELVLSNQDLISKAHKIISNYVHYGEAKSKTEARERRLQLRAAHKTGS